MTLEQFNSLRLKAQKKPQAQLHPKLTARDRILAATGRSAPEPPPARSAEQIMKGSAALAALLALRDSL